MNWLRKKIINWLGIEQFYKMEEMHQKNVNALLVTNKRIKRIKKEVSTKTGVSIEELESRSRKQHIVRARNIAMKRCRKSGVTLERIGSAFNRHHSTVIHSISTEDQDKEIKELILLQDDICSKHHG